MNVEVIIPSKSIIGGMGRDLLNKDITLPADDLEYQVKQVVKEKFLQKYSINKGLFEWLGPERTVYIEVQDDISDVRPRALAAFNLHKSDLTGDLYFSVSSHLVYTELLSKHNISNPGYSITDEGYWSHEFIHLLDWDLLSKRNNLFKEAKRQKHYSSLKYTGRNLYEIPREWEVLLAVAYYRDEGLAVLYEYLCGESNLSISGHEACRIFNQLFRPIILYAHRSFHNWDSVNQYPKDYIDFLTEFRKAAYVLGPYWVMDALYTYVSVYNQGKELLNLVQIIKSAMSEMKETRITQNDAIHIIKLGLSLDLCSYIELLTNDFYEHTWGKFLNLNDITELYNFISYEGSEPADNFMTNIYSSIMYSDTELYLKTVLDIIGSVMDEGEIREEYNNWLKRESALREKSSVGQEISIRLEKLMAYYGQITSESGREILLAALTYVFDPEDYIHDKISVMGFLDDLYILRAACVLLDVV